MNKEVKIVPPKGYEVDKEHSTFECIKFKPIEPQLPKTWLEFCKRYSVKEGEYFIDSTSNIEPCGVADRNSCYDRNVLPSGEYAEAMLALCQLIQLRDCYNNGWKPDWTGHNPIRMNHCIGITRNRIVKETLSDTNTILAFKTSELRDKFLDNFRDLIEIAKPLL